MPRKLTIFLSAPPGDGIRPSREFFKEYVKPVLVAAALDYDVIEGRKEGDVRYGTAEQIRRLRRSKGEKGLEPTEEEQPPDTETIVQNIRHGMSITSEPGVRGDLVLGRHTWKEYIRGLNEGWLGPVEEPLPPPEPFSEPSLLHPPTETQTDDAVAATEALPEPEKKEEEDKREEKRKRRKSRRHLYHTFPSNSILPRLCHRTYLHNWNPHNPSTNSTSSGSSKHPSGCTTSLTAAS